LANLTLSVAHQLTATSDGKPAFGAPKSKAGIRTVSFPRVIFPELREHLAAYVGEEDEALIFTSPSGKQMQHSNFYHRFWIKAAAKEGLEGVHFHDLRHAGNALSADAGANLRELMDRMGHSTTRAALVYLHSTDERQRTIADLIDQRTRRELRKLKRPAKPRNQSGTEVARRRKQAS
jgi:integrase